MNYQISQVSAREILDSRSRPTLAVALELASGVRATAMVPSGASTGSREAVELRDNDPERFGGAGVLKAVANVEGELRNLVTSRSFADLAELDAALIDLDGTPNKSRLGANAILGISLAFARAAAQEAGEPLWRWLPGVNGQERALPVPCFNVLNGGVHAANPLTFQEFMICPVGAPNFAAALQAGSEIYSRLKANLTAAGQPVGLGDEGGFAPMISRPEEACDLLVAAISDAGYPVGSEGVMIALDPAASEFFHDGRYQVGDDQLSSHEITELYRQMISDYPIWSLEDGVAENDDDGWRELTDALAERVQLVGDDNFCTNPAIIKQAIADGIANASLIKLNQIGTITETLAAMQLCHDAGYRQMISHRSGETPDDFIADFSVATGARQLKSGAPARGERVAKYNRLLEISAAHPELSYGLS